MKRILVWLISIAVLNVATLLQSCNEFAGAKENANEKVVTVQEVKDPFILSEAFKNYWYAGKAELCSYQLKQARYGEIHEGNAVTIFVTEDFSQSKQVKLDRPEAAGADRLPVMKLNLVKKFNTGIYPYSMMLSVFSPVDLYNYPEAVKVAANVQEWCGITYMQMNRQNNKYHVVSNSYFEDEGDHTENFEDCFPEDELWNLIRMAPEKLPVGEQHLLPGSLYTRMTHIPLSVQVANLSVKENGDENIYTIDYAEQKHTLNIHFEKAFPYKITGWDETFAGFDGKLLTTTATLNKTMMSDYWVHHNNVDRVMREQLGLPVDFQ
ncbi:MAG: hypothetical protein IPO83_09580 [Chitinophagaceae bacterium]|nr:hypothetical protein [Chitinophagaceae bacterium]